MPPNSSMVAACIVFGTVSFARVLQPGRVCRPRRRVRVPKALPRLPGQQGPFRSGVRAVPSLPQGIPRSASSPNQMSTARRFGGHTPQCISPRVLDQYSELIRSGVRTPRRSTARANLERRRVRVPSPSCRSGRMLPGKLINSGQKKSH
jgi:hypothetical protein